MRRGGESVCKTVPLSALAVTAKVRYMDSPVILAVDEDPDALRNIDQELNDRYARHYSVRALPSATKARE